MFSDRYEIRKEISRRSTYKHYHNKLKLNRIKIYCDFCKEEHEIAQAQYDINIEKNGRYICIKENGAIVGNKPKKKKVNPYAAEGKKQCSACQEIKLFNEFSPDNSRSDGLCSKCKKCRRKK